MLPDPARGLFCNRTLNMRRLKAIGYDMDYTLLHYHVDRWEGRAYAYVRERLAAQGWPVGHLEFQPNLVTLGLIIDTERGNVVKADRFGYIKKAFHGTNPIPHETLRELYHREMIDLSTPRWEFMNTLFSISEATLFLQFVDLLDAGHLENVPGVEPLSYDNLYRYIRKALDETHLEGRLKADIVADPDYFVDLDPDMPHALLDQRRAGKKVLLITNSELSYAIPMLTYAFDRFLPKGLTWRDVFSLAIFGARKPSFFSSGAPAFEVVDEALGLLREHIGPLQEGKLYVGGNAGLIERTLGAKGDELLYVGDHVFADVRVVKDVMRWRTCLVLRELEPEMAQIAHFKPRQEELHALMAEKEALEVRFSALRLELQRNQQGYGPRSGRPAEVLQGEMTALRTELVALDARISPIAQQAGSLVNPNWGPIMRAGSDKSHLARQVERTADLYTGRVSNFLTYTPFAYLRAHRGSLPHDAATAMEADVHELS